MIETGLSTSLDAIPMSEVYKGLDSSPRFMALVDLQHVLHNNNIKHPGYVSHYVVNNDGSDSFWQDKHPEVFDTYNRHDWMSNGKESKFWKNLSAADAIGWGMESNNPDNKWEWGMDSGHETNMDELLKYFSHDIQTQYDGLSAEQKAELETGYAGTVPDDPLGFQEHLQKIGGGPEEDEVKQFRISRAIMQYAVRQGTTYYYVDPDNPWYAAQGTEKHGTGDSDIPWLSDIVDPVMWNTYKKSLEYYKDWHPKEAASEMKYQMFQGLYGGWTGTHGRGAFGIKPPPGLPGLPRFSPTHIASRAFMFAHTDSKTTVNKDTPMIQYSPTYQFDGPVARQRDDSSGDIPAVGTFDEPHTPPPPGMGWDMFKGGYVQKTRGETTKVV